MQFVPWDNIIQQVLVWALTAVVGVIVGRMSSLAKSDKEERMALYSGVRALLRSAIMNAHHEAMRDGYISTTDREVIERAYNAYHGLDGNGVATKLYNEAMSLPTREHEWNNKDRKE